MKLKIKKGDTVKVIAGASKGQQGEILSIDVKKMRVTVEGIREKNKKHVKPQTDQANPDGGIIDANRSIHISNVALVDPSTNEITKVGKKEVDGERVRYAKKSGEVLN